MARDKKNHSKIGNEVLYGGKVLPHSKELEMNVLGGLIIDNNLIDVIVPIIQSKYFYSSANTIIYESIIDLRQQGFVVDLITLTETLKEKGKLDEIGGPYYLAELSTAFSSQESIVFSAHKIKENWVRRDFILLTHSLNEQCYDVTMNTESLLQKAQEELDDLTQLSIGQEGSKLTEHIEEAYQYIQDIKDHKVLATGVMSGFTELDGLTGGFHGGELIIIAGRPSHGKTTLALDISRRVSKHGDKNIGLWSIEMSAFELALRHVCSECKVNLAKVRAGKLSRDEYEKISKGIKEILDDSSRIIINDSGAMDVLTLCAEARKIKKQRGLDMVIVDYLQLMTAYDGFRGDRHLEVAFITRQLKRLAKELGIPVVALSQLSRKIEDRAGREKRPQLSDLRESGSIEQDADVVIFVHRPEMYIAKDHPDYERLKGYAEIVIGKQRNGPIGEFRLTFLNEYTTFENYVYTKLTDEMEPM